MSASECFAGIKLVVGNHSPLQDGQNERPRVEHAHSRHMHILKGRHSAERMLERSTGEEVAVDSVVLVMGRPLTQSMDDVPSLMNWKDGKHQWCVKPRELVHLGLLTWVLHDGCRWTERGQWLSRDPNQRLEVNAYR